MKLAPALLALAAAAGALGACHGDRTEVVVVVSNGGVRVPEDVDSIDLVVVDPAHPELGAPLVTQHVALCGGPVQTNCASFPITLTLVPGPAHPNDPVRVQLDARKSNAGALFQSDASTFMFHSGVSARLDFTLWPRCIGSSCQSQQGACTMDGSCMAVQPIPFTGEPALDAGVPSDGGPSDGGPDGRDGSSVDAGPLPILCGALSLDGLSGSYLSSSGTQAFAASNSTVEAWVRLDQIGASAVNVISRGNAWSLALAPTGGDPKLVFLANLADSSMSTSTGPSVKLNRWSHVVAMYDAPGNSVTLIVDGQVSATFTLGMPLSSTTAPFQIGGATINNGADGFTGAIDDVRISTTQRYASVPFPPPSHHFTDGFTYALYHLDDGAGHVPTDAASSDTLTLHGGAALEDGACAPYRCGFLTMNGGTASSLLTTPGGSFTVEQWVRADDWGTPTTTIDLASFPESNGSYDFAMWARGGQLGVTATCPNGTSSTSVSFPAVPLRRSIWSHVAVTFDGTNQNAQVFVDGFPGPKTPITCGMLKGVGTFRLGYGATLTPFAGIVDEARVSLGVRYTTAFEPGGEPLSLDGSTIGLWHFDEGGSKVAHDAAGTHDLSLQGGAITIDSGCR